MKVMASIQKLSVIVGVLWFLLRGAIYLLRLLLSTAMLWLRGAVMMFTYGISSIFLFISLVGLVFNSVVNGWEGTKFIFVKYWFFPFFSFAFYTFGIIYDHLLLIVHPDEDLKLYF